MTLPGIIGEAEGTAGAMLIERVLQDVLRRGFYELKRDTSIVDDLFYKLRLATRNDIKEYLEEHDTTVYLNFPKETFKYPLLAIVNASDDESEGLDALGDHFGGAPYLGGETAGYYLGHGLNSRYNIFCLAGRDSNAVLWLYYLAKAVLMINRETLDSHGLYNVMMSGQDVSFKEDLLPEFSFARLLTVSCVNYFAVQVTQRVASKLIVNTFTQQSGSVELDPLVEE